jgi:hypothetical protein
VAHHSDGGRSQIATWITIGTSGPSADWACSNRSRASIVEGASGTGALYFFGGRGIPGSYRLINLPITEPDIWKSRAKRPPARALIGGDHVAMQQDIELGGMASVAWPGLRILSGLYAPLPGLEVELLLLRPTPGGASLGAVAMSQEVTA